MILNIFNRVSRAISQHEVTRESGSYFFIQGDHFYKHTGRPTSANSDNMALILSDEWRCERCGNGNKNDISFFVAFQYPHYSSNKCKKETEINLCFGFTDDDFKRQRIKAHKSA